MLKFIKSTYLYFVFIVVVALLMMCLMWSVYLIPVEKISKNIKISSDIMEVTPERPKFYGKIPGFFFDTWTDSRILNVVNFAGTGDSLRDSLFNYRVDYFEPAYISLSVAVKSGIVEGARLEDYARYWVGFLVFLKPLMVFFDLQDIRYINLLLQLGLLLSIFYLMYKRLGFKHCVAFGTVVCFLNPITSWMCLQYAASFNIMLLAILWLLMGKNIDDKYIFFVIGAITAIFDFLTYPLVTLGMPLIIYICLYERGFKDNIKCVIKNSLLWSFGYVGMWVSKWILATLLTDQNIIQDGLKNVSHKMWGWWEGDPFKLSEITYFTAVTKNLNEIFNIGGLVYIMCFGIIISVCYYIYSLKFVKNVKTIILLGIGCMPFVWVAVIMQHSIQHPWMSYKILGISIYAILVSIVCCLKPKSLGKKSS